MITSLKFDSDTLSHTTNVVPLVHIEKTIGDNVNRLGFSTQQLDFTDIDDTPLFYSPLLLDMPSLSESIDFENKKYKISSVTLKLSNMEYLGERLSDKYNILLNSIVTVWYKTQNANTLEECLKVYTGKITRITHDYDIINLILEDKSQSKLHKSVPINKLENADNILDKYKGQPIPMVYGHVDRSPLVFTDQYKTLKADNLNVQFYIEPNIFLNYDDPLFMDVGHKINIRKQRAGAFQQYWIDGNTITFAKLLIPPTTEEDREEPYLECYDSSKNYSVTLSNTREDDIANEESDYFDTENTLKGISDGSYDNNVIDWFGYREITTNQPPAKITDVILFYDSNDGYLAIDFRTVYTYLTHNVEALMLKLFIDFTPQYDHIKIESGGEEHTAQLWGMAINGVFWRANDESMTPLQRYYVHGRQPQYGLPIHTNSNDDDFATGAALDWDDSITGISKGSDEYYHYDGLNQLSTEEFEIVNNFVNFKGDTKWGTNPHPNGTNHYQSSWEEEGNNPNAAISYEVTSEAIGNYETRLEAHVNGNFNELDLIRRVHATNVIDNDFYGNVIGRSHENIFVYRDFIANFRFTDTFSLEWIKQFPFYENGELSYGKFKNHNIDFIYLFQEPSNPPLCIIIPDFIEIRPISKKNDNNSYLYLRFSGKIYTYNPEIELINITFDDLYLLESFIDLSSITRLWFKFKDILDEDVNDIVVFSFDDASIENIQLGTLNAAEKDKPSDIMLDILQNECNYTDEVSENEIIDVRESHDKWSFGFTQHKSIDSKKLIEEFSASTKSLPRFRGVDGKFVWNTVKDEYTEEDVDLTIKSEDIIRYSYDKTKLEDVKTKVRVKYWNDYADNELKRETSYMSVDDLTYQEGGYDYDYYGIDENDKDSVLEFESKYIRDEYTAEQLRNFLLCFNMNQHNIIKATLPLVYANLEVGDVVAFDKEIQELKLYGETYTTNIGLDDEGFEVDLNKTYRNGQQIYPYFMIYKTKKNIDKIDIEIIQLHKNDPNYFIEPSDGDDIILLPTGDVNGDGNINVLDVVAVVSHILGTSQLTVDQGYEADLNQDNNIDILDVVQLMEIILG
tara:strand:+ start:1636 stop:4872 length:3237 start_codon:yes stop_codon:yes gene_type:complete